MKTKIYIGLFAVLYSIVALVSLFHSFAFFGLANDTVMSVMLGVAFEVGQAAVLFSILTSDKDRTRVMPWVLMCILTAVQILGNVFSSYKYLMTHNVGDLQYFKEPIFIWTQIPDNMATVIITYIVGAILPVIALCMTSMVANYMSDNSKKQENNTAEDKSLTEEAAVPAVSTENFSEKNSEKNSESADTENTDIENSEKSHFINL